MRLLLALVVATLVPLVYEEAALPGWSSLNSGPFTAADEAYFTTALFIGDSLTSGLKSYNMIPEADYLTAVGVNLETMQTAPLFDLPNGGEVNLWQALTEVTTPQKIYIMLGTNGVAWQKRERMIENYTLLLDFLNYRFPDAQIYVQSILPAAIGVLIEQPDFTAQRVAAYNEVLQQLAEERGVVWLDIYSEFADSEGYLLPTYAAGDGIHLNREGYRLWLEYLKSHVIATR